MKFFSIFLLSVFINFSSFAFIPAENNSNVIVSKENTSKVEKTKIEAKKATNKVKMTSTELIEKLEANKSKMNFKERLATKLITKKLRKLEKKNVIESTKEVKDGGSLAAVFRIIGTVLIILGVVGLFVSTVTAGVGAIILGVILLLLPSLI